MNKKKRIFLFEHVPEFSFVASSNAVNVLWNDLNPD